MESAYHSWIMIFIFLVVMPGLIYGAYKIKLFSLLWSPLRTQVREREPAQETVTVPKNVKNIQRMQEIEADEENYKPQQQILKEKILEMKNELEKGAGSL